MGPPPDDKFRKFRVPRIGKCKPRAGCPSTSVNPAKKIKVDTLIRAHRRITIDELVSVLGVSHGSAQSIVESLKYSKVCARWVPRQLTDEHKAERVDCCTELRELSDSWDSEFSEFVIRRWAHFHTLL